MSTPTGGNGGNGDTATLSLGVDTRDGIKQVEQLEKSLNQVADTADLVGTKIGTATIRAVKKLEDLKTGTVVTKQGFDDLQRSILAQIEAEKEIERIQRATADAGSNLVAKLRELNATFGMSTEELYRYRAAQLGVINDAEPLIANLERLTRAEMEHTLQQKRDIEVYQEQVRAYQEITRIEQERDVWLNEQRNKQLVEYVGWWEKTLAAQDAALAKQTAAEEAAVAKQIEIQQRRDVELWKMRQKQEADYVAFWERELAAQDAAVAKGIALAEKQAIEEIKWAETSAKQKVAILDRLRAYQANPAISQGTIENTFSAAAIRDLPNYDALVQQLASVGHGARDATQATNGLSAAFGNNRVRTEAIVIAHEALQGRFTRIPGSLMVMMEYLNSASISLTGFSMTTLGVVAALGVLAYEVNRGEQQTRAFNDAINRTNGFAGETRDSLEALAQSVGKVHGAYTDAYKSAALLTSSGKFTKDQIDEITASATGLAHAFGVEVNKTISEFETLVVRGTTSGINGYFQVSKAIEKLDEHYHFLTVSQMEAIIQLEKEGKSREASALAIKLYAEETKRQAEASTEYIGWIERGWHAVTGAVKGAIQAMADIGKKSSLANQEQTLINKLAKNDDGSIKTDTTHMSKTDILLLQQYYDLEQKIGNENERAAKQADQEQKAADAKHLLTVRAIEDVRLMKKSQSELKDALDKFHQENDIIEAGLPGYKKDNAAYLAEREENIIKTHTQKVAAVKNDGRKQDLQGALDHETALFNMAKQSGDARIKLIQDQFKKGSLSQEDAYEQAKAARAEELTALENEEKAKLAILEKYKPLNNVDAANVRKQIQATIDAYNEGRAKIAAAQALADQQFNEQQVDKYVKAINKSGDDELKRLNQLIDKQKEKNGEIGKTKEQIDLYKQAQEDAATNELQAQADAIQLLLEKGVIWTELGVTYASVGSEAQKMYEAELDKLKQIIEKRREYSGTLNRGAELEAAAAAQKEADQLWKQTNKKIGDDLASAIVDGGGKGLKKLIHDMEVSFAKTILHPIIEPVSNFVASVVSPNATAAGSGANLLGTASSISNSYNLLKGNVFGGAGTAIAGVGNGLSSVGSYFGLGSLGGSGLSAFGAGMAGTVPMAGGFTMMTGAAETFASAGMAAEASAATFGAATAAALPWIGGVIAAAALWDKAFGHGPAEVQSQGIKGWIDGSAAGGISYQNIKEKGGWFRSDSSWMAGQDLTKDFTNTLYQSFLALRTTAHQAASDLGLSTEAIDRFQTTFDITLTNDTAANQKALTDYFSSLSDDMAKQVIPNIAEFSQANETASQTLTRLNNVFKVTDLAAQALGKDTKTAFGAVGLASDSVREQLVSMMGGLDAVNASINSYTQNYLTDSEKIAPLTKAVSDALDKLGLSSIQTEAQLKAVVAGLDLSTQDGVKRLADIMSVQDAFFKVQEFQKGLTKDRLALESQLADLTNNSVEKQRVVTAQRQMELDSMDASLRPLQERVWALQDEADAATKAKQASQDLLDSLLKQADSDYSRLSDAVSAQKTAIEDAYNVQKDSIQSAADVAKKDAQGRLKVAQDYLNAIQHVTSSIQNAIKSTIVHSTQLDYSRRLAAQKYLTNLSSSGADLTKAGGLDDALANVSQVSTKMFATELDFMRDQARTKQILETLGQSSKTQEDYTQLQIDGINATIAAIDSGTAAQLAALDAKYKSDIAEQDKILNDAKQRNDLLKGINSSVLSVRDALVAFNNSATIAQAQQAVVNAPTGSSFESANGMGLDVLYQQLLGRPGDAEGLAFWQDAIKNRGATIADVGRAIMQSNEYKWLHPFADGINVVPKTMPALLHEGERVMPKADNNELMSLLRMKRSDNSAVFVSAVQRLEAQFAGFRAENKAGMVALQRDTAVTASKLKRLETQGIFIRDATSGV